MCISLSKCLRRFHLRVFTFCFEVTLKFNWDSCLYIQPIHIKFTERVIWILPFCRNESKPCVQKMPGCKINFAKRGHKYVLGVIRSLDVVVK